MKFLVIAVLTFLWSSSAISSAAERSKRALIFEQGGTATILAALAIPVDIEMPHAYVAINYAANYMTPQNSTWFTQPFNRFHLKNKRDLPAEVNEIPGPINRSSFYKTVVRELDKFGMNGKMCLLSTICEINSDPLEKHNGVLGSVLQVMFSPSLSNREKLLPDLFYEAETMGRESDCKMYKAKCPLNILDLITHVL